MRVGIATQGKPYAKGAQGKKKRWAPEKAGARKKRK